LEGDPYSDVTDYVMHCNIHRGSTGPAATTNMAAANFVVITNGKGCALTGTADIDQ